MTLEEELLAAIEANEQRRKQERQHRMVMAPVRLEVLAGELAEDAQEVVGVLLREIAGSIRYERKPYILIDEEDEELLDDIDFEPATPEIGYVAARLTLLEEDIREAGRLLREVSDYITHTPSSLRRWR